MVFLPAISHSSYLRLHRISTAPKKRPRPSSDNEESEASSSSAEEEDEEEEEDEAGNDTEATEEQQQESEEEGDDGDEVGTASRPPPAKRARTVTEYTCADLISAVRRHRHSWPFQDPVDADEVSWLPLPVLMRSNQHYPPQLS